MHQLPLMQQVLGNQWEQLPPALQAHYTNSTNNDIGTLDIEYPHFMQLYLNLIRVFGALINQQGKHIPTIVHKWMENKTQRWKRTIQFDNGKTVIFQSRWEFSGPNELIEYVNSIMGLRMTAQVKDGKLYYQGICLVLKLGHVLIPIPEWLVLGHTTIEEIALDETHFAMDFKLTHPIFGLIYRYAGEFHTET